MNHVSDGTFSCAGWSGCAYVADSITYYDCERLSHYTLGRFRCCFSAFA